MEFIARRRRRLDQLVRQRPELAEIFGFYDELYGFLARQNGTLLSCTGDPAAAQVDQGFPLLNADNVKVDPVAAGRLVEGLVAILQRHGREGLTDLERLAGAIEDGRFEPAALFGPYVARDRYPLVKVAEELTVAPALLEYVVGLACSFALQKAREAGLQAPVPKRPQLYCPLCGGAPVMGELVGEEGRMQLHCGTCGESWPGARRQCSCCGNRDETTLEYFIAGEEKGYRVNVCRQCSGYLKVVDSRQAGTGLPMDLEDLATLHLDLLAQREGFTKGKQVPPAESQGD